MSVQVSIIIRPGEVVEIHPSWLDDGDEAEGEELLRLARIAVEAIEREMEND